MFQMINPMELIRENIRSLAPYSTARDEYQGDLGIYLDANENPNDNGYNRYPDPYQTALKAKLSQIKGVDASCIFVGNGSDEPIDLAFRVFCTPSRDNVVSIAPTYGMYKVAAAINDVEIREVALKSDYSLDYEGIVAASDANTKLLFLCSPNNPTANSFPRDEIVRLVTKFPGVIVLDEAYIDFSEKKSLLSDLDKYPNLIILQTLSKAWGMAGLRLGLAFARKDIIDIFTKVKYPYNINDVTQRIVLEQLNCDVAEQVASIVAQRAVVVEELTKCRVIKKVYPSDANFVLVVVDNPRDVYSVLIDNGIIVRDRSKIKGCAGCLRVTIGTEQENRKMLAVLHAIDVM